MTMILVILARTIVLKPPQTEATQIPNHRQITHAQHKHKQHIAAEPVAMLIPKRRPSSTYSGVSFYIFLLFHLQFQHTLSLFSPHFLQKSPFIKSNNRTIKLTCMNKIAVFEENSILAHNNNNNNYNNKPPNPQTNLPASSSSYQYSTYQDGGGSGGDSHTNTNTNTHHQNFNSSGSGSGFGFNNLSGGYAFGFGGGNGGGMNNNYTTTTDELGQFWLWNMEPFQEQEDV